MLLLCGLDHVCWRKGCSLCVVLGFVARTTLGLTAHYLHNLFELLHKFASCILKIFAVSSTPVGVPSDGIQILNTLVASLVS